MKVLFVTTSYPSKEAPATGAFVLEHARAVRPGADVAVLHLDRRHDIRSIHVRREDGEFPLWRVSYPYRPTAFSIGAHVAAGLAGYRAVRRTGFDPDLIHAHFFLSALPAAFFGKPLVETEQWTIFLPEDPARLTPPLRLGARLALARARLVLPVSRDLEDAMRAAGIRGPFRVIPNAVDTSLFRPGPGGGGNRISTVGLLQYQKGVDDLLRAVAFLRASRPALTLDVVGDGPERASYEALATEIGLEGAVTFHGLLPKAAIADLLSVSDVFALASRFDNNPCVLVEAQAAGLPIVSTRVGGIPELVGGDGVLGERDDPQGLAGNIATVLDRLDTYDRGAIAERARDRFSVATVGQALLDSYDEVLAQR
ncbi:MAG TPA: glycosyltransferase [Gaiellaceae bacterium]|nr:glycosyltransferase [Gaiellaceae bacterium]